MFKRLPLGRECEESAGGKATYSPAKTERKKLECPKSYTRTRRTIAAMRRSSSCGRSGGSARSPVGKFENAQCFYDLLQIFHK